ncbi:hypothetical protein PK98_14760 [Croceibacterium mercuriale]|uniref:Inositol monophosphatase n=1 Tax=Croceibacterium mercuriale TaxID=1572751 RepID=A0A0B2BXD5_9SPHN|nr:hypothetical protein PK98_14760 [Croceibacterium mercuriale]
MPQWLHQLGDIIEGALPKILAGRTDVVEKPDGSLVTAGDLYVESLVEEAMAEHLPDAILLSEERILPAQRLDDGLFVIVDPIDGTENFAAGLKEWGTGISVWDHGTHLGSMLLMPELSERLVTGDGIPKLHSRITGLSSTIDDNVREALEADGEFRIIGCAVYNLYNVVRGAYTRFLNPRGAYVWDLLPGIMLAAEHGCDIEINGEAFNGGYLDPARRHRVDIRHRYDLHPG